MSRQLALNTARRLSTLFGGYFQTNTKHDHNADYGYPDCLAFHDFYRLYKRHGIARAVVQRPVNRTWHDYPWLLTSEPPHDETPDERNIRLAFDRLQFWAKLADADEKSRVGEYAGVILRFGDGKHPREPVQRVPGGLDGLVEMIPVFEAQLEPGTWDTDPASLRYGQPITYLFNESAVGEGEQKVRTFEVHYSRVHIWSKNGTVHGESSLEAPYNALLDIEKVRGAGGEGFWRNAKNAPIFNVDKDANLAQLAAALGTDIEGIADKLDEVVNDYQRGFDKHLLLQGMETNTPQITLPDPEPFILGPMQEVSAASNIPLKILVGNQNGERASTEDRAEWDETIMARRENMAKPNIMRLVQHLVEVGVMPSRDYVLDWSDLTAASQDDRADYALKLSEIKRNLMGTGEVAVVGEDIREALELEPLEDLDAALPPDAEPEEDDV